MSCELTIHSLANFTAMNSWQEPISGNWLSQHPETNHSIHYYDFKNHYMIWNKFQSAMKIVVTQYKYASAGIWIFYVFFYNPGVSDANTEVRSLTDSKSTCQWR